MNRFLCLCIVVVLWGCSGGQQEQTVNSLPVAEKTIRIATFNTSMFRKNVGDLIAELATGQSEQVAAVAEIIRLTNPDIILLSEFDYDAEGAAIDLFQENFLSRAKTFTPYPYSYVVPSNTGIPSGADLDNNGKVVSTPGARSYGNDAFGYGTFEGQYGFAVLSRYPIDVAGMRSFQQFKWQDMPDNVMPTEWYSEEAQMVFRVSSKNHVDVPVVINGETLHLIVAHPTPPAFDGPEDRNGRRNHDEIRLLADYIDPAKGGYLVDDQGKSGGLTAGARFVVMGDLNADPVDGDSYDHAILQLTQHRLINDPLPASAGGADASKRQGGQNERHGGAGENDTADFRDKGRGAIGNLRIDYVLPSKAGLKVVGAGVFWPAEGEKFYDLVGAGFPPVSSDHRLVWLDVVVEISTP